MPFGSLAADSGKQTSVGKITQPFVPETYRCVATYETKDIKNRPFKVEEDEMVEVFIKDQGGKLRLAGGQGRTGSFSPGVT